MKTYDRKSTRWHHEARPPRLHSNVVMRFIVAWKSSAVVAGSLHNSIHPSEIAKMKPPKAASGTSNPLTLRNALQIGCTRVLTITHVFAGACQWKKSGQASGERMWEWDFYVFILYYCYFKCTFLCQRKILNFLLCILMNNKDLFDLIWFEIFDLIWFFNL